MVRTVRTYRIDLLRTDLVPRYRICRQFVIFKKHIVALVHCVASLALCKKIGIVGYWATSISTVRSTVLSKKNDKYGFISGFGH